MLTEMRSRSSSSVPVALSVAAALLGASARASILETAARLSADAGVELVIPVCLVEGSSTRERSHRCAGCAHGPNPGLARVVERVRAALARSWEAHGNVRFVGFDWCKTLDGGTESVVGLFIHPRADNAAYVGPGSLGKVDRLDPGVGFKPWGNGASCIELDWSQARMEYRFDCVEQYAIHEFGHVLGFVHEWRHPNKPAGCNDDPTRSEPLVAAGSPDHVIVSPSYDWDSIMTYTDACAHVTGVRFGSPDLSPTDIAGVSAAYPRVSPKRPEQLAPTPALGGDDPANGWGVVAGGAPAALLLGATLVWRWRRRRAR